MSIFVKQKLTDIENIVYYTSILSTFIPLFFLVFLKRKHTGYRALLFYLIYCLLTDLLLNQASLKYLGSEIYSYRLFTLVEYSLLTFYIWHVIEDRFYKNLVKYSSIIFFTFLLIDSLSNSINQFDSIPTAIESILILSTSIILIYEKVSKSEVLLCPSSLISTGLIIFFSGTFFLFLLSQNNFNESDFSTTYGYLISAFNIIKNIFLTLGILSEEKHFQKTERKFLNI